MTMRISKEQVCKTCKSKVEGKQLNLPEGFTIEYIFCKVCNEANPGYTPRIVEVYRLGQ